MVVFVELFNVVVGASPVGVRIKVPVLRAGPVAIVVLAMKDRTRIAPRHYAHPCEFGCWRAAARCRANSVGMALAIICPISVSVPAHT